MYDLAIVGGGTGGYVAAIRAAQLGGKVALIERDSLGGTCLNRGCIPTKALVRSASVYHLVQRAASFGIKVNGFELDFPAVQKRKEENVRQLVAGVELLLKSNGVDVFRGTGSVRRRGEDGFRVQVKGSTSSSPEQSSPEQELEAKRVILATGSQAARPPLPGMDLEGVISSDEALELDHVPESLVVIGGGVIGLEFAGIYRTFGARVAVVEMLPNLLPMVDEEISRRLLPVFKKQGLEIHTSARVKGIQRAGDHLTVVAETPTGEVQLTGEYVLVATGRRPNFGGIDLDDLGVKYGPKGILVDSGLATNVPGLYAIGDVTGGIMLAHVASTQGIVAVERIFLGHGEMDYGRVPSAIFTYPEVATVGLSEKAAREAGHNVQVAKFPYSASGKAVTMGETEGLVKLVANGEGKLLGLHIFGENAADLIHEGALALTMGATVKDIVATIHAHPTLSETIHEAAHGLVGGYIHLARPSTRRP